MTIPPTNEFIRILGAFPQTILNFSFGYILCVGSNIIFDWIDDLV